MSKYTHIHGGVGAPVGLTVFKTAGGSLGAAPGGFDSHTPLPLHMHKLMGVCHLTHSFAESAKLWNSPIFGEAPAGLCQVIY